MKKYETDIRVIYADTDQMGIVYYVNYIRWFEIGRNEYMRQLGFPYKDVEAHGVWLPVAGVTCDYKAPAHYDDIVTVRAWTEELKGATLCVGYEIVNKETGELLVKGTSKHPVTNPQMKPIRLRNAYPELYARILEDMQEEQGE